MGDWLVHANAGYPTNGQALLVMALAVAAMATGLWATVRFGFMGLVAFILSAYALVVWMVALRDPATARDMLVSFLSGASLSACTVLVIGVFRRRG